MATKKEPGPHSTAEINPRKRVPTAWEALALSVSKVRQLVWAYGVVGIVAVAAIIQGIGVAPKDLTVVALPILLVMLLVFIFSIIAKGPLGVWLSWVVMLLLGASAIGLVSSVFFDVPKPITVLASDIRKAFRFGDDHEQEPPEASYTVSGHALLSSLPPRFTAEPNLPEARKKAGELVVDGGSITVADSPATLVADKLTLKNGARILTTGAAFNVVSTVISSERGSIVAFGDAIPTVPPAEGAAGRDGLSAKPVVLNVLDRIEGSLRVDLSGEAGGPGAPGKNGIPGAAGAAGDNASSGLVDCRSGAGNGQPGRNGSDGARGGSGGAGGNGGNLVLVAKPGVANSVQFISSGGAGGPAGPGGKGGAGGLGGKGGSEKRPLCVGNGQNGVNGSAGQDGSAGAPGGAGSDGAFDRQTQSAKK